MICKFLLRFLIDLIKMTTTKELPTNGMKKLSL